MNGFADDDTQRRRHRSPLCAMVGPDGRAQGGVASVVQVLHDAGLFSGPQVRSLASFVPGGKFAKLKAAAVALARYLLLLLQRRGAVLHVHVSSNASFWRKAAFIWLAVLAGRAVVFHLHGGAFRQFVESRSGLVHAIVLATMRRATRLLCLSTQTAGWLRAVVPGVPVLWWPNPVPDALFAAGPGNADRQPIVLYLGALLPAKGCADLLQAFSQLQARHAEACLVIAGSGPEQDALQAQARQLGVAACVKFVGWIDAGQRAEWLGRARMLVLPSHLEAQPMVLLEAMAAGLPVVATDVGGIPDIVVSDRTGLLVPAHQPARLAAAMSTLWNDPALRARLAAAAHEAASGRHRASAVARALLTLYGELAPTHSAK